MTGGIGVAVLVAVGLGVAVFVAVGAGVLVGVIVAVFVGVTVAGLVDVGKGRLVAVGVIATVDVTAAEAVVGDVVVMVVVVVTPLAVVAVVAVGAVVVVTTVVAVDVALFVIVVVLVSGAWATVSGVAVGGSTTAIVNGVAVATISIFSLTVCTVSLWLPGSSRSTVMAHCPSCSTAVSPTTVLSSKIWRVELGSPVPFSVSSPAIMLPVSSPTLIDGERTVTAGTATVKVMGSLVVMTLPVGSSVFTSTRCSPAMKNCAL